MRKIIIVLISIFLIMLIAAGKPQAGSDKISLKLKAVPLVDVLNMIALQYKLNLVVSGEVAGEVTIHLENVDIFTALNTILNANGYNYFIKDDVVVVKPREIDAEGEYQSQLVILKYISPETARKALEPRLTPKGKIIILDPAADDRQNMPKNFQANRILITERITLISELLQIIREIDVPERLIQIEAKIIETTLDNSSKLGFLWPSAVSAKMNDAEGLTTTESSTTTTTATSPAGIYDFESESGNWGKLSVQELSLVLDLLKKTDNTKIISDPHITTLENHEAEIGVETVYPIQTINRFSEGAVIQDIVTFQDVKVGITLKVTPRINVDGKITLEVNPTIEDIIGYAGTEEGNRKPIKTARTVKTRITVDDGETIALGGLLKENEIKIEQKVPLLGYIPILGRLLFTNKSIEKKTTDLIILITPRIVK